jgi:hypothetical protein
MTLGLWLFFPSEGGSAVDFYRPKNTSLRLGSNPRTFDPIANTLTIIQPRLLLLYYAVHYRARISAVWHRGVRDYIEWQCPPKERPEKTAFRNLSLIM